MPTAVETLWAANALWPGQAIVERLRDQVRDLRSVEEADDYDPESPETRQLPCAIVLLYELRVTRANVYTQPVNCEQDWMVAMVVRSARSAANADSAQVGVLLPKVVAALHGYVPDGAQRGLMWRTGPRPVFRRDRTIYPLLFTLRDAMA